MKFLRRCTVPRLLSSPGSRTRSRSSCASATNSAGKVLRTSCRGEDELESPSTARDRMSIPKTGDWLCFHGEISWKLSIYIFQPTLLFSPVFFLYKMFTHVRPCENLMISFHPRFKDQPKDPKDPKDPYIHTDLRPDFFWGPPVFGQTKKPWLPGLKCEKLWNFVSFCSIILVLSSPGSMKKLFQKKTFYKVDPGSSYT